MTIRSQLEKIAKRVVVLQTRQADLLYAEYRDRPVDFCSEVLKVNLVPLQRKALELLLVPPYRVLVPSANEQGKTFFAACAVIWWFCSRRPVIIRSTAPSDVQVRDLLWKEIRAISRKCNLKLPLLPKACRIERSADDFAEGRTARDENTFKGQHGPHLFFVFDEATGIDAEFWTATETMFSLPSHAWLAIFNPTTTSSQAYVEYKKAKQAPAGKADWHIVHMSAMDHPNIIAGIKGEPEPIPHAMRFAKFNKKLEDWSVQVNAGERKGTDIEWPVGSNRWLRPGPLAEVILLGRYPSQGSRSIWGEQDWDSCCRPEGNRLMWNWAMLPQIGADIARYGEDHTALHVRWGPCSVQHVEYGQTSTAETAARIINLAREWATRWAKGLAKLPEAERPQVPDDPWRFIPIKVDADGLGAGVVDELAKQGCNVHGISAQSNASDDHYDNVRSELWMNTALEARRGRIDTSFLDDDIRQELGRQACMIEYKITAAGRLKAESKEDLVKRLKRSPDSMDAFNLAYYHPTISTESPVAYEKMRA